MNSDFWNKLEHIKELFFETISKNGIEVTHPSYDYFFEKYGWVNKGWTSEQFRLAHINVVDAKQTKGLWMMHCCIFPHFHNPGPIFGFDIIASRHKITGCFHDFSATSDNNHPLIVEFEHAVSPLEWKRERTLPEWAENIFSQHIVAAGNLSKESEIEQLFDMVTSTLPMYIQAIGESNNCGNSHDKQNYYCQQQKLNPHNKRAMTNLSLSANEVEIFINDCMFPEV